MLNFFTVTLHLTQRWAAERWASFGQLFDILIMLVTVKGPIPGGMHCIVALVFFVAVRHTDCSADHHGDLFLLLAVIIRP